MRIFVVEDDRESREGICNTLHKVSPESMVFCAGDAQEALKILAKQKMDLIFLDIRMPGMDGLVLLEQIRKEDLEVSVVVLSAYDQFSYAQKAIRLGAMDYVVKPYEEQTIAQIIERVNKNSAHEDTFFLTLDLGRWFMSPSATAQFLSQALRLSEPEKYHGRLLLFRVFSDDFSFGIGSWHDMMKWIYRRIKEEAPADESIFMLDGEGTFPLVLYSKQTDDWVPGKLNQWIDEATAHFGGRICCLISEPDRILLNFRQMYTKCQAMMEYAFYFDKSCVIAENMLCVEAGRRLDERLLDSLREQILKGDAQGACVVLNEIKNEVRRPPYMPVQRLLYSLHAEFVNLLSNSDIPINEEKGAKLAEKMAVIARRSWQIEGLFCAYQGIAVEISKCVMEVARDQNQAIIQRCLEYLQEHYSDSELTQEAMARKLYFSVGYFGNMFRQVTGESFVHYLNKLRINKAKILLKGGRLKIYEIARQTGFSSVNYFIRVFKQQTQMSPNQYRMLYTARSDGE